MSGDLALLDLGHAAFGDAHLVGHLLLGHAAGLADFGEAVADHLGKQLVLASLAAGPLDVLGANVIQLRKLFITVPPPACVP